jgi:RimJ/RimL family protein N-acetyltransferase
MKTNEKTVLRGVLVTLVPYKAEHVLAYHEWMKDPFLQETTASEPLTLKQEYEMQISWHEDPFKCTFILNDITGKMVGDVNLFLNHLGDPLCAEIEVMIAEPSSRRKGMGAEAVRLMMDYGKQYLNLQTFVAKISYGNFASLNLFQRLGFVIVGQSEIFKEYTLQFITSE